MAYGGSERGERSDVRPGVDVKGDGGYIVAAPSVHESGLLYRYADGLRPTDIVPAPVPGWLLDLVTSEDEPARAESPNNGDGLGALLAALASAIGNSRRLRLKRGWVEPAILWTAIVGDSGTMKSPALELVLRPVRERQRHALAEYNDRMERYRNELLEFERDLGQWKRSKAGGDPPTKPDKPIADRCWCDDSTVESLVLLLKNQWRGLLMAKDELAGWLTSFDRYSAGSKGGDVARWLEMHGGRPIVIDRKTGTRRGGKRAHSAVEEPI